MDAAAKASSSGTEEKAAYDAIVAKVKRAWFDTAFVTIKYHNRYTGAAETTTGRIFSIQNPPGHEYLTMANGDSMSVSVIDSVTIEELPVIDPAIDRAVMKYLEKPTDLIVSYRGHSADDKDKVKTSTGHISYYNSEKGGWFTFKGFGENEADRIYVSDIVSIRPAKASSAGELTPVMREGLSQIADWLLRNIYVHMS